MCFQRHVNWSDSDYMQVAKPAAICVLENYFYFFARRVFVTEYSQSVPKPRVRFIKLNPSSLFLQVSFKYKLMHKLKDILSWSATRVNDGAVLISVTGYTSANMQMQCTCWVPLTNVMHNISTCESFNSTFVEEMIEGGFIQELDVIFKTIPNHHQFWSLVEIGRCVFTPDTSNQILSHVSLHPLLPHILPLKYLSTEEAVNVVANLEGVTNNSVLALAYDGHPTSDMSIILSKTCRSKLAMCLRRANLSAEKFAQFEVLMEFDLNDSLFAEIPDVALEDAVQVAWPSSITLRKNILERCFALNCVSSIGRPLRFVAASMCHDDKISLDVNDELDGSCISITGIDFDIDLIHDISPLFLEQLLSTYTSRCYGVADDVPVLLFGKRSVFVLSWKQNLNVFAKFAGFRPNVLPISFKPNEALTLEIVKSGRLLVDLLPLVYLTKPTSHYKMALNHYYANIYTFDMLCMFTYKGLPTWDLDAIRRDCQPGDLLSYILSHPSPRPNGNSKEALLLLISPYTPADSKWHHPHECCVCYEPHFGHLDVCKHFVCQSCTIQISITWPIKCPMCRQLNTKYIFE